MFGQRLTDLTYIICLNSKILQSSSSELELQKLFSLVTEKKCDGWLDFLVAPGIVRLYRKWPWQNPGDLIASPAAVPTLQLVSQAKPQRVSEWFTFITARSAKSLCKRVNFFSSFPSDRPAPESGIKESSSWGTQRTQDMFYETRTPAFERGHSEEIPIERVSKQGEDVKTG